MKAFRYTNGMRNLTNIDVLFVNRLREMASFELGKEIEKDGFCPVTSVGQRRNSETSGFRARDGTKNIFLYFFIEFKTYHLSYSIYKHDVIDFADPSSIRNDLSRHRASVAQW